jgi:CubicO group peptidase (beta-lactamase class C family)
MFEYSNFGYFVLGEIITVKVGKHWSEFIEERVLRNVGLNMTRPSNQSNQPNYADGYYWNGRRSRWQRRDKPVARRPSGPFASTVLDLATWDQVLRTDKILTSASRDQMWTPVGKPE